MNKRFIKAIYILSLPILASFCLIMYWRADLIVDKIHYGIFMIVFLILMLDNSNNGNNRNKTVTN